MLLDSVVVGPLGVNCYLLACEKTKEGIIVDPGASAEAILDKVDQMGITVKYVINTHGHFDHVGANAEICSATGGALLIHADDAPLLLRAKESAALYGVVAQNSPSPDQLLQQGMTISFGTHELKVLHTPGHTRGGCCLYGGTVIITGDTLFANSIGRTDLPGGSEEVLHASIRNKLYVLPDETVVYPGHGPSTTIGNEKKNNPYVRSEGK